MVTVFDLKELTSLLPNLWGAKWDLKSLQVRSLMNTVGSRAKV